MCRRGQVALTRLVAIASVSKDVAKKQNKNKKHSLATYRHAAVENILRMQFEYETTSTAGGYGLSIPALVTVSKLLVTNVLPTAHCSRTNLQNQKHHSNCSYDEAI